MIPAKSMRKQDLIPSAGLKVKPQVLAEIFNTETPKAKISAKNLDPAPPK